MSRRSFFVVLVVCALAFAFLGARGIWDPDEGRYTNVALMMLDSGDWLSPMRNEVTAHWTKPPMTYWLIAASVASFGREAWAARLPMACAFVVCAWCTWGIARVLWPERARSATLVFATMLAPLGAAHFVSTDFPLAAAEACALFAYVRSRFGEHAHAAWLVATGAAFGVAFLIKGPPGLLPLLAIAVCALVAPLPARARWPWIAVALATFCVVALPWYVAVVLRHDGLLAYFVGAEVLDRVATDRFDRNGEWYGWLKVYAPALLLGAMPWTRSAWRWVRTWKASMRAWRSRAPDPRQVLLIAWVALPLLVFCVARSRLPLYVLPLFVPLALGIVSMETFALPRRAWLAAWCLLSVLLRFSTSAIDSHKDASTWADAIRARATAPVRKVVFLDDTARWGLHLRLGARVERRSWVPVEEPRFGPRYDGALANAFDGAHWTRTVFVARQVDWDMVRATAERQRRAPEPLGKVHAGRVFFLLRPLP